MHYYSLSLFHSFIPSFIPSFLPSFIHSFYVLHSCVHSFTHPSIHPSVRPSFRLSVHPSIHPFIHSFPPSFLCSIVCSFIHLLSFFVTCLLRITLLKFQTSRTIVSSCSTDLALNAIILLDLIDVLLCHVHDIQTTNQRYSTAFVPRKLDFLTPSFPSKGNSEACFVLRTSKAERLSKIDPFYFISCVYKIANN